LYAAKWGVDMKVGLIAGQGALPRHVVLGAHAADINICVATISGFADTDAFLNLDRAITSQSFGLAEFGKITRYFSTHACTHICFAGYVKRPNFLTLKPDMKGLRRLPGAIKAAQDGDNALLSYVLNIFEDDGFEIISPQDLCKHLLLPEGHLGAVRMGKAHRDDAQKACEIAREIGRLDIGQGAVVCHGLVLAVEAQEGTDAMLERVSALSPSIRGVNANGSEGRAGVLAKMIKPGQETRVDLPVIGVETVNHAAQAGLAGIVAEGGRAFVIDHDAVINAANTVGMFIAGLPTLKS